MVFHQIALKSFIASLMAGLPVGLEAHKIDNAEDFGKLVEYRPDLVRHFYSSLDIQAIPHPPMHSLGNIS